MHSAISVLRSSFPSPRHVQRSGGEIALAQAASSSVPNAPGDTVLFLHSSTNLRPFSHSVKGAPATGAIRSSHYRLFGSSCHTGLVFQLNWIARTRNTKVTPIAINAAVVTCTRASRVKTTNSTHPLMAAST